MAEVLMPATRHPSSGSCGEVTKLSKQLSESCEHTLLHAYIHKLEGLDGLAVYPERNS